MESRGWAYVIDMNSITIGRKEWGATLGMQEPYPPFAPITHFLTSGYTMWMMS